MPTQIVEDVLDVETGTLEAIQPGLQYKPEAYPYVTLRRTGRSDVVTLRTVALENALVRAVVALDLGGRLLSLADRRTGKDAFPKIARLNPVDGGPRGAWLPAGMQFLVDGAVRRGDMGPVEFQLHDPEEEGGAATVLLHELVAGQGLSWHGSLSLSPDSAAIRVALRVFNRALVPAEDVRPGLRLALGPNWFQIAEGALVAFDPAQDRGVAVLFEPGEFEMFGVDDHGLVLFTGDDPNMPPRATYAFECLLVPLSGLESVSAVSEHAGLSLDSWRLRIQAHRRIEDAKIAILLESGQTLEAPADLYPERILEMSIKELPAPIDELVLLGKDRQPLLRWSRSPEPIPVGPLSEPPALEPRARAATQHLAYRSLLDGLPVRAHCRAAGREPGLRAGAALVRALEGVRIGEIDAAQTAVEEALNANGEDALAWWLQAALTRLATAAGEETDRPGLLNAHYLAPMEPVLRAESFLSVTDPLGKEPSPIVRPIAGHPEALIEAAVLLIEAGLPQEATRWIDEALRHNDLPGLRYLQAWLLLESTRMGVEAASHVRAASEVPLQPPYPSRAIECRAIRDLCEHFPDDSRLAQLKQIIDVYRP